MKLEKLKTEIPFKKEKCNHDNSAGYWIVEKDGEHYMFTGYNNNFSKNQWLTDVEKKEREKRIKMLRWVCTVCCTAQMP